MDVSNVGLSCRTLAAIAMYVVFNLPPISLAFHD